MSLYTGQGDDGSTGLPGGKRLAKNHPRIACIGGLDELNAALGLAAAACPGDDLRRLLHRLQADLFGLGADLAGVAGPAGPSAPRIGPEHVARLEKQIDDASAHLPPLNRFILPGGSEPAARLHLARSICRRTERQVVALAAREPVNPVAIVYLNRLSDLLFALARLANHQAAVNDITWDES